MNNQVKLLVFTFLLCIGHHQGLGRPATKGIHTELLPYNSYGDLNMPGFQELNNAINLGTLDVSPSLATMPSYPKKALSDIISMVLGDLAESSRVRGEIQITASLKSLQKLSTDFEQVALAYNRLAEAWDMVDALKYCSLANIALRSQLENSVEVIQGAVKPMIESLRDLVFSLGSEPEIVAVQHLVDDLLDKFDGYFAQQVSNTAKILHDVQSFLSSVLNYRALVPQQLRALTISFVSQRNELKSTISAVVEEVLKIEVEIRNLENSGFIESYEMMQIASSAKQVNNLLAREIEKMTTSTTNMAMAAKDVYVALQNFAAEEEK